MIGTSSWTSYFLFDSYLAFAFEKISYLHMTVIFHQKLKIYCNYINALFTKSWKINRFLVVINILSLKNYHNKYLTKCFFEINKYFIELNLSKYIFCYSYRDQILIRGRCKQCKEKQIRFFFNRTSNREFMTLWWISKSSSIHQLRNV